MIIHRAMAAYRGDSFFLLIHPGILEILASIGSREPRGPDAEMEELVKQWSVRSQVPWDTMKRQLARKVG